MVAIGGINTSTVDRVNRKVCAFCGEEFKPNEGKTRHLNEYYHLSCYEEMMYKINDMVHMPHGMEK